MTAVNVPVSAGGPPGDLYSDPEYQRYLQAVVQEVVLRYSQMNVPRQRRDDEDPPAAALVPA